MLHSDMLTGSSQWHASQFAHSMPKKKRTKNKHTTIRLWCLGVEAKDIGTLCEVQGIVLVKVRRPVHIQPEDESTTRDKLSAVTTVKLPMYLYLDKTPQEHNPRRLHDMVKTHVLGLTQEQRNSMLFEGQPIQWEAVDW